MTTMATVRRATKYGARREGDDDDDDDDDNDDDDEGDRATKG